MATINENIDLNHWIIFHLMSLLSTSVKYSTICHYSPHLYVFINVPRVPPAPTPRFEAGEPHPISKIIQTAVNFLFTIYVKEINQCQACPGYLLTNGLTHYRAIRNCTNCWGGGSEPNILPTDSPAIVAEMMTQPWCTRGHLSLNKFGHILRFVC